MKFAVKITLLLLSCLFSFTLFAQSQSRVIDAKNLSVADARVIVRNQRGVIVRELSTNERGEFSVPVLPAGEYFVTAEANGLAQTEASYKFTSNGNVAPQSLQIKLQVAAIKDSIIVSATRTENNLSVTPASAFVISAEDLARSQRVSVLDTLRSSAGVSVMQTARRGGITSIFVRGGESDYTKVLVDGIPLNDAGGAFDFSDLTTDNVRQIELVRGSNSALYGSDAMSGVLQFVSARGTTATPEFTFSGEGGSFAFNRQSAKIAGANGGFDYAVSFSRLQTNGRGRNDDYQNRIGSVNLGYRFNERANLRVNARSENSGLGVPGATAQFFNDPDERARRRRIATGVKFDDQTTRIWHQQISFVFAENNQRGLDPIAQDLTKPNTPPDTFFAFNDFVSFFNNHQKRRGLRYQSDVNLPHNNLLSAGIEYEKETAVFDSGTGGKNRVNPERTNVGTFIQNQFFLGNRFVLTAGLRMENNRANLPANFVNVLQALGSANFTGTAGFGTQVIPKTAALFTFHKGNEILGATKLRASFGTGIKSPTLVEAFSPNSFFLGNPSLKPERARSFDAGVEQLFWRDRVRLEATFFANHFRNQIAYVGDPATFGGPVNLTNGVLTSFINNDRARANGLEVSAAIRPVRQLSISGNYTLTDTKILAAADEIDFFALKLVPNSESGLPLLRRPRHSGALNLAWSGQHFGVNLDGFFIGQRRDVDPVTFSRTAYNNSYAKIDLMGNYNITPRVTAFARIENLLNQNYQEVLGFPAYRLNFAVGLRFKIGGRQ